MAKTVIQSAAQTQIYTMPPSLSAGIKIIRGKLRHLSTGSGVYRMLDAQDNVLYVGKARNLKARVRSYTQLRAQPYRILRMIALTRNMVFVRTATESDALLLEISLIKKLRPRFNVLMRDDKSFPYILLTNDEDVPRVMKHRGAKKRKGKYFGPFASAGAVNRTLNTLQRAFLLRSCSDTVYRTRSRPCLLYQIKRCSAPCTGEITLKDYQALVDQAHQALRGRSGTVQQDLSKQMQVASAAEDFEYAARLRDRISALTHVQNTQGIIPNFHTDTDVLALAYKDGYSCVQVYVFRAGQNLGHRAYYPRHDKNVPMEEILESFIGQFYENRPPPQRLLLNLALPGRKLLAEALSLREGYKVRLATPRRGHAYALCQQAELNASNALAQQRAQAMNQNALLAQLADTFQLPAPPQRIEVYDNSHLQGNHQIGAMIVAGPEGFIKTQYRQFNIKDSQSRPGDDYAMLAEVLQRRLSKLTKDNRPDLLLIDGGKGQLNTACKVLAQLQLSDIPVVAIAKGPNRNAGEEMFYLPASPPKRLAHNSPLLYYLQRLRDEAHRFAIGTHRARRKSAIRKSLLDDISGIGAKRKRALLHHFGSVQAVRDANCQDLEKAPHINAAMAQRIYDHFHDS